MALTEAFEEVLGVTQKETWKEILKETAREISKETAKETLKEISKFVQTPAPRPACQLARRDHPTKSFRPVDLCWPRRREKA